MIHQISDVGRSGQYSYIACLHTLKTSVFKRIYYAEHDYMNMGPPNYATAQICVRRLVVRCNIKHLLNLLKESTGKLAASIFIQSR